MRRDETFKQKTKVTRNSCKLINIKQQQKL